MAVVEHSIKLEALEQLGVVAITKINGLAEDHPDQEGWKDVFEYVLEEFEKELLGC